MILGGAALGYFWWHERVEARAHALLAQAIAVQDATVGPPPATSTPGTIPPAFPTEQARAEAALVKFKAAADAYPSTDAGIFARYQEGRR